MTLTGMTVWGVLTKLKNSIQEQAVFPPWPELYNTLDRIVWSPGYRHLEPIVYRMVSEEGGSRQCNTCITQVDSWSDLFCGSCARHYWTTLLRQWWEEVHE